jgi:predicted ester cyclase
VPATTRDETAKAVIRRWNEEGWSGGKYELAEEIISPEMVVHGAGGQQVKMGPAGLVDLIRTWRTAFPDGSMSIDDLIVQGDLVGIRNTWRGTHRADFYGTPASGRYVEVTSIGLDRVVDGKVVEGWGELDMVGMMQTIGALPKLGPGAVAQGRSGAWGDQATAGNVGAGSADIDRSLAFAFLEAENWGDRGALEQLVDVASFREHNPVFGTSDFASSFEALRTLRAAMPDLHYDLDAAVVIAEGDKALAHAIVRGTHTGGPLFGVAPSGKQITWTHSEMIRVERGLIVERWVSADTLTLLQQLGAFGAPAAASAAPAADPQKEKEARNIVAVLARIDAVNRVDLDALDAYYTDDYKEHNSLGSMPPGLEGVKQTYKQFLSGLPDQHFEVTQVWADGDRVVVRGVISGTHRGNFFGIAATYRKVVWTGIEICGMRDGRVADRWLLTDLMGMFQQMGVVPSTVPDSAEIREANKRIMQRLMDEVWTKGNLDAADELFSADHTSPDAPTLPPGPAGTKMIAGMFRTAFPDLKVEVLEMMASGDRVAARLRETGTHKGDLMGIAPTGKSVDFGEMAILRIANGKIAESWYQPDMPTLMQQLGVMPAPGS